MRKDIQILLVDDHQVVRDGLQHMLEQEEDMEVIGQCANGEEALSQIEMLSPNIVLMDIKMPGVNGIELTRQLLEKHSPKIIMLTLYDEYLAEAMRAGAGGYLLKDIKRAELARAIRQVHGGEVVIGDNIAGAPRAEYEQAEEGVDFMLEEVQMVIPPPIDANQLIRFVSRVEEMLESRMLQMVGSWNGGSALTIPLSEPATLENILSKLGELSEVGTIREKPLTGEVDPKLFKKTAVIARSETTRRKTIFVTLKNGQVEGQAEQRDKESNN